MRKRRKRRTLDILLKHYRLPLLPPTVHPQDARARLREKARARGSLLKVENASAAQLAHTCCHAANRLDKGRERKGAPE